MKAAVALKKIPEFSPKDFLATIGTGRKLISVPKKRAIFSQGDKGDAIFYVQKGRVRLSVVSKSGKEATIGIVHEGDFLGEGALAGQQLRMSSASAMVRCELLRVDRKVMMDALHREHSFSYMFVIYLLARYIRF